MGVLVQLGVRSSGAPVVTDISMSSTSTESVSVAASDTGALVTWLSEGRILARRVTLEGAPVDPQPLVVCEDGSEWRGGPVSIFDGTNYVIGFFAKVMNRYRLRVASVARDGAVATPCGQVVATAEVDSSNRGLNVATGNGTTTFVWEQRDSSWDPAVRVVRTRAGAAVDATPLTLAQWVGEAPSVTWNGTDFLVAWSDVRRGTADVRVARLPPSGALRDPNGLVVSALDVDQRAPRLAFDGRRYLLLWTDGRSGQEDVRGAWVAVDLSASTDDFPVAASADLEFDIRVAAHGPGRFVVGYTRFDRTPGVVALRAAARDVVSLDPGEACQADGECPSGFCVDGVCCDSACGRGASDCQACSVAAGAPTDGTCAVLPAMTTCRAAASTCDVAEVCDGSSPTCGADALAPDGLACQGGASAGACRGGVCRTDASPRFTSPIAVGLTCGETWRYSSAGRPTVAGEGPFSFSARTASGEALPEGFLLDPMTGELSWQTTRASPEALVIELRVESPTGFDTQTVQLEVECQPRRHSVGCSAGAGAPLALVALLLVARRRRR
jgi:hypothetical protein